LISLTAPLRRPSEALASQLQECFIVLDECLRCQPLKSGDELVLGFVEEFFSLRQEFALVLQRSFRLCAGLLLHAQLFAHFCQLRVLFLVLLAELLGGRLCRCSLVFGLGNFRQINRPDPFSGEKERYQGTAPSAEQKAEYRS